MTERLMGSQYALIITRHQFGEVFISSPNPQSVSSLDTVSDWVLVGCSQASDQPQQVRVILAAWNIS